MGVTSEAWRPPPGWRAEFERQATRAMLDRVNRYARKRARMVLRTGRKVDGLYARELAHDALSDTLDGTVTWDPTRVPLVAHVMGVVRRRSWHEMVRATRAPHRSLDDSRDDSSSDGRPLEAEASRAVATEPTSWSEEIAEGQARRVVLLLRQLAGDDRW